MLFPRRKTNEILSIYNRLITVLTCICAYIAVPSSHTVPASSLFFISRLSLQLYPPSFMLRSLHLIEVVDITAKKNNKNRRLIIFGS